MLLLSQGRYDIVIYINNPSTCLSVDNLGLVLIILHELWRFCWSEMGNTYDETYSFAQFLKFISCVMVYAIHSTCKYGDRYSWIWEWFGFERTNHLLYYWGWVKIGSMFYCILDIRHHSFPCEKDTTFMLEGHLYT